jgi:hypothetical protein
LTFEVERLASWLESLSTSRAPKPHISFTEPLLQLRLIQFKTNINFIRIDLGYIPRVKLPEALNDTKIIRLFFPLKEIDLTHQAQSLRAQLSEYPQRVFR